KRDELAPLHGSPRKHYSWETIVVRMCAAPLTLMTHSLISFANVRFPGTGGKAANSVGRLDFQLTRPRPKRAHAAQELLAIRRRSKPGRVPHGRPFDSALATRHLFAPAPTESRPCSRTNASPTRRSKAVHR